MRARDGPDVGAERETAAPPPRVALDASPIRPRPTGVGRYTTGLARAIPSTGIETVLVTNRRGLEREVDAWGRGSGEGAGPRPVVRAVPVRPTLLWLQVLAARSALGAGAGVFHATTGRAPLRWRGSLVVTVHDLTVITHPHWYGRREAVLTAPWLARSIGRADAIIAVSEATRADLERLLDGAARGGESEAGIGAGEHRTSGAAHGKAAHGKAAHGKAAHGNAAHGNAAHGKAAHGKAAHGKAAHGKAAHTERAVTVHVISEAPGPEFVSPIPPERIALQRNRLFGDVDPVSGSRRSGLAGGSDIASGSTSGPNRYWLFVGAMNPRKNPLCLVEAFARAVGGLGVTESRHGGHHREAGQLPHLVMAGPGGPLAGQVGRTAARLGVADMIHSVGWVADMPALMAGAELLVCPSLHEGFALTVVEAMAVGTSVVASKRGALPETLREAGLLVEPSVDDLTGALVRAGSDSELRVRLSDQGIVRAREFSWRRAATETAAVYRSVGDRNWS